MAISFQDKGLLRKRFYAFFVDLFIVGVVSKVFLVAYMIFIESSLKFIPLNYKRSLYDNLKVVHLPMIFTLFFGLYFLSLYIGHGRSPGKAIMKLRVISKKTPFEGLSIWECFTRAMAGLVCYLSMCSLFVFSLFNKAGNGFPEWISGTTVVTDDQYEEMKHQKEKPSNTFVLFENDVA